MKTRSAYQISPTTRAYYPLNGNSVDISGNGNTGTDTAIAYASGRFGRGAYIYDDTSTIYSQSSSFNFSGSNPLTMSGWLKVKELGVITICHIQEGSNGAVQDKTLFIDSTGAANFYGFQAPVTANNATSPVNTIIPNTWYNLIGTYDGTNLKIYVNGVLKGTQASSSTQAFSTPRLVIGVQNAGQPTNWIDEVIIDARAWTAAEVSTYYRKSKLNYNNIFRYPINPDISSRYWVGGSGTWDASTATHWALTSNGAGGASAPAFGLQPVYFDANSGVGTTTLTTGTAKSITFTGFTGEFAGSGAITLSGDLTFSAGMTNSYTGAITFNGANQTLTTAGKTILSSLVVAPSGNFTLADNLTLGGSGTVWSCTSGTIVAGTTTIKLIDATSTAKTFAGGGKTYNNLWLSGAGTGAFIITGANVFNDFKCDTPPHTITFPASVTTSVSTFTVNGTAGNLMTLQSSSAGTRWRIRKNTAGVVSCDYLSVKDSQVIN